MKKKVEDILVEENISLEKIKQELEAENEERSLATQIFTYLSISKNMLSASEKKKLKYRIRNSVDKRTLKRIRRRWLAAASSFLIIAALCSTWFYQVHQSSAIAEFAENINENNKDTITRLVLNEKTEIRIRETESVIAYDKKGEKIAIGATQKVQQKLEPVKPMFNTLFVPYGKRAQITLSDGTTVWLNSGSKLVYPAVFTSDIREVYIDGEAIFDVSKDPKKPFVVKSHYFDIEVVGTVFNISAYSDDAYSNTVLEQGVIKLVYKTKAYLPAESKVILPGDMAVFNSEKNKFELKKVDPSDHLSWRKGYYVFRSERLGDILKRLSRYYNVEILLPDEQLFYDTFSGSLDLKSKPEEVLNIIKKTTPFNFRKEGQKIIVYKTK